MKPIQIAKKDSVCHVWDKINRLLSVTNPTLATQSPPTFIRRWGSGNFDWRSVESDFLPRGRNCCNIRIAYLIDAFVRPHRKEESSTGHNRNAKQFAPLLPRVIFNFNRYISWSTHGEVAETLICIITAPHCAAEAPHASIGSGVYLDGCWDHG